MWYPSSKQDSNSKHCDQIQDSREGLLQLEVSMWLQEKGRLIPVSHSDLSMRCHKDAIAVRG